MVLQHQQSDSPFKSSLESDCQDVSLKLLILHESYETPTAILGVLNSAGYKVTFSNTATKQEFLQHLHPGLDLIVIEGQLKQWSGIEALSLVQKTAWKIPCVVVNGSADIKTAIACMKAGAKDYLLPDQLSQLSQIIQQVLPFPTSQTSLEHPFELLKTCKHLDDNCSGGDECPGFRAVAIAQTLPIDPDLMHTQEQLKMLMNRNADGVVVVDFHGIVRYMNPAAQNLLGWDAEELLGQMLGFPTVEGEYLEVDIRSRTGMTAIAQMRVNEIHWQREKAYLVTLRDISELKQAELERLQLLEKVELASRVKDQFLAILSHELRTPLNPILGWSRLLRRRQFDPETTQMALEAIERNATLQAQLIEDVLDLSRIVRGQLKLEVHFVDLGQVIKNALEAVSLAAQAKSITIKTDLSPQVGQICGDPVRLQQVFWNLLANAIKFTPNGGTVGVHLSVLDDYATIQIQDSGKGIPPEFLPHVFEYFRQADSSTTRLFGGLGLGLSIVRHLVELHGGTVKADSAGSEQGATFTVSLPRPGTPICHLDGPKRIAVARFLEGVKVLVVEDDVESLNLLRVLLEERGAEVKIATSGMQALEVFTHTQPSLMVSDLSLPAFDGYELMRLIRQLPPEMGGNVPAIALTQSTAESEQHQCLEAGYHQYVSKPVELDCLLATIKQLLPSNVKG